MKDYKTVQDYVLFQDIFMDTMGTNIRAAKMENRKAVAHKLLCLMNPLISTNQERLRRVKILQDGIKKAGIPTLYSPIDSITQDNQVYLVYEYFKGRTLEKLIEDANQKGISFSFDLALSIAIAIADIIESGGSIVISGEKSFHGFLTPDNILFHFDGKIFLKNYGVFQYMDKSGSLMSEFESRYGNWQTPECLRREKIVTQSDVYHLGYIIFRLITGKFFSLASGEDFETKVSNLNLRQFMPTQDKELHASMLNFFKKTLNPDPMKRFLTIKEFKDFIANYFHIEELSSITFNVAYFMNLLYSEVQEREEKLLHEELGYSVSEPKKAAAATAPIPAPAPMEPVMERAASKPTPKEELVSSLLESLDEKKKTKKTPILIAVVSIVAIAVVGVMYMNQAKKAKLAEQQRIADTRKMEEEKQKEIDRINKQNEADRLSIQQELDIAKADREKLEKDKADSDKLIKAREKEAALLKQKEDQERQVREAEAQAAAEQSLLEEQKKTEALKLEEDKKKVDAQKKVEEEAKKAKTGELIGYNSLDVKPERTSGETVSQYLNRFRTAANVKQLAKEMSGKTLPVAFQVNIDEKGTVLNVRVSGNPPAMLKQLIIDLTMKWTFTPPQKDGVKVKTWKNEFFQLKF